MSTYRSAQAAASPRLSVRIRQTPLPLVVFLVTTFVAFGAFFSYDASRYGALSCRREEGGSGACTVRTGSVLGHADHTLELSAIHGARVEQVREGKRYVQQVVLDTRQGKFVLGRGGTRSSREVDVAAIQAFLRGTTPGIFVERYGNPKRAIPWLLGTLVLALGIGVLIGRVADLDFRVEGDRLVVRRRELRGPRVLARIGLDEVDDVIVDRHGKDAYRLVLTTTLGERISLEHYSGPGYDRRAALADDMRAFLREARTHH